VSDPGGRGHNKTQIRLAGESLLRHIPPNYSLKRTVQSLRDWSCRLAQALGPLGRELGSMPPAPSSITRPTAEASGALATAKRRAVPR